MLGVCEASSRAPPPCARSSALREERLLLVQTGSSSPCLDLRYLSIPTHRVPRPLAGAHCSPVAWSVWPFPWGPCHSTESWVGLM